MNFPNPRWLFAAILYLCAILPGLAQVADPVLSVAGFNNPPQTITVGISDATTGATIRYTTDGTTPTNSSSTITSGNTLNLSQNTTLKVLVFSGTVTSDLVTAQYSNLGLISSSGDHTVVLNNDGSVSAWGNNTSGQLGTGYTTSWNLPLQIQSAPGAPFTGVSPVRMLVSTTKSASRFLNLQAGDSFTMFRESNGTVYTWGDNGRGQQGDNQAENPNPFPQVVPNLTGVVSIAAAGDHAVAAKSDGTVWAWGADDQSQCGDGGMSDLLVPTRINGLSNIVAVYAGQFQGFAVDNIGNLYGWGTNNEGQLGDGTQTSQGFPEAIKSSTGTQITGVLKVVSTPAHTLLLKTDGTVWASGSNYDGALGDGTNNNAVFFQPVPGLTNVVDIAAGGGDGTGHSMALLADGSVEVWGTNYNGQLGDGNYDGGSYTPETVTLPTAVSVLAVDDKSFVVLADGTVRCFGGNAEGEMGNGTVNSQGQSSPVQPTGITNVNLLAAGTYHVVVATSSGAFYGWGDNTSFKLTEDFNNFTRSTEVHDDSDEGFSSVASAETATIGFKNSNGTVWAVGNNSNGELGQNNWTSSKKFLQVTNLPQISSIFAGEYDAFAIDQNRNLWAWGANGSGQLGVGNYTSQNVPGQVANVQNVIGGAAGDQHLLVVESDGTVWAAGDDSQYELGDGNYTDEPSPIQVVALSGIIAKAAAAGSNTSFVLDSNGNVWAWGQNDSGQLGLNPSGDVRTPTIIPGLPAMAAIAAHADNGIGIDTTGNVWTWGSFGNSNGSPMVQPGISNVTAVAVGDSGNGHGLAVESNGTLWGWGYDGGGELGNGSYNYQSVPTQFNDVQGVSSVAACYETSFLVKQDGSLSGFGLCDQGELAANLGVFNYSPKTLFGIGLNETPPTVSITSPSTGTSSPAGTAIQFQCSAASSSASIAEVDYYLEGVKLGASTTGGTWNFSYTPVSYGDYTFEAVAIDSAGAAMISTPVTIDVAQPQPTFQVAVVSGTPQQGSSGAFLASPLVVRVTTSNGSIEPNASVTFAVTQGTGLVAASTSSQPATQIQLTTDANGLALAYFKQPLAANYMSTVSASAGQNSATFTATTPVDDGPPLAPSGLTETGLSSTQIELDWTNNADNATSIVIQESTNGTTWTTIATLTDPTVTSYQATGLTSGQSYYFQEIAENNNGPGGTTDEAPDTSDDPTDNPSALPTSPQANDFTTVYADSGDNINGWQARNYSTSAPPVTSLPATFSSDGTEINGSAGAAWSALPILIDGTGNYEIDYDYYGNSDDATSHILMVDDSTNGGVETGVYLDYPHNLADLQIAKGTDFASGTQFTYPPTADILSDSGGTTPNLDDYTWLHGVITKQGNTLTHTIGGQTITADLSNLTLSTSTRVGIGYYGVFYSGPMYRNIKVQVPSPELAVDSDRNGTIVLASENPSGFDANGNPVDTTTQSAPYRFWLNNNQDTPSYSIEFGTAPNTVPPQTPDSSSPVVVSSRDLEDWTRLWIYLKPFAAAISQGQIKVGLKWTNTQNNPGINLITAAASDGGAEYLSDVSGAGAQAQLGPDPNDNTNGGVYAASPFRRLITDANTGTIHVVHTANAADFVFPSWVFNNLSSANPNTFLLFSGYSEGQGALQVVLLQQDGVTVLGKGNTLWLDIRDVKEMYERAIASGAATGTSNPNPTPPPEPYVSNSGAFNDSGIATTLDTNNPFSAPWDETQQCVCFVHGWFTNWNAFADYSDTFYKRLWWQGYKGRFIGYTWPALSGATTYNPSEWNAWLYGRAFLNYINSIKGGFTTMTVAGHSQGNVVVGSAIQEGLTIDNYILLEAALPTGCYTTLGTYNSYQPFLDQEGNYPTPDTASQLGYRGFITSSITTTGVGNYYCFYNPQDYALATGKIPWTTIATNWEADQLGHKPDGNPGLTLGASYSCVPNGGGFAIQFDQDFPDVLLPTQRTVNEVHESMSFVARPRSKAIGADTNSQYVFPGAIDTQTTYGFDADLSDHSGQFLRDYNQVYPMYSKFEQIAVP